MNKKKNIYTYKPPKSMNEETHYFLTKGRIGRKAFLLRILLSILLSGINLSIYYLYALPKYWEKAKISDDGSFVIYDSTFKLTFNIYNNFTFKILPFIIILFLLIQTVKRLHDVNKSGLSLKNNFHKLFSKGTSGNNDYGIDPQPSKKIIYFDELEN